MAEDKVPQNPNYFNPSVTPGGLDPFYSRGQSGQRFAQGDSGALWRAAKVIPDVIKATDQTIKTHLTETLTKDVDEVRDISTGVIPPDQIPPELATTVKDMDRVTRSRNAGVMSDVHYWALMDLHSRKARLRWPGYREYIDSEMSRLTGAQPANALRSALTAAASGSDPEKNFRQWVKENEKYIDVVDNTFWDAWAGGSHNEIDIRKKVAKLKGDEFSKEYAIKTFDLEAKAGTINKDRAADGARSAFWGGMTRTVNGMTTPFGKTYEEFSKTIETARAAESDEGTTVSRDERVKIAAALNEVRRVGNTHWQATFTDQDPHTGFSYSQVLDGPKMSALQKEWNDYMDMINDQVNSGDYGFLKYERAAEEDATASDVFNIKNKNYAARVYAAYRQNSLLGPAGDIVLSQGEALSNITRGISETLQKGIFAGDIKDDREFVNKTTELGVPTEETGKATKVTIESTIDNIKSGRRTPEEIKNGVEFLFGPGSQGLLNRMGEEDSKDPSLNKNAARHKLYMKMMDPLFLEQVKKHNPAAFDTIVSWSEDSFASLLRTDANAVQNIVVNPNRTDVHYDTENHQLYLYEMERGGFFGLGNPLTDSMVTKGVVSRYEQDSLDKLNLTIKGLANLYETSGLNKDQINERISTILTNDKGLGINLSAQKGPTAWRMITDKLSSLTEEAEGRVESGEGPVGAVAKQAKKDLEGLRTEGFITRTRRALGTDRMNLGGTNIEEGERNAMTIPPRPEFDALLQEAKEAAELLRQNPEDPAVQQYYRDVYQDLESWVSTGREGAIRPLSGRANAGLDDLQGILDRMKERSVTMSDLADKLQRERGEIARRTGGGPRSVPGGTKGPTDLKNLPKKPDV